MTRIGLFGGSFDPIHTGHLITASFVAEIRSLEKILFVPCWVSPLKTDTRPRAVGAQRLEMVRRAIAGHPRFDVSDIEINRTEVSYTIDTVRELKKQYDEIELIIGYDNLVVFDKWKNPAELLDLVTLIVLKRKLSVEPETKNIYFDRGIIVNTPEIEISSTTIRQRAYEGKPIEYLVPDPVAEYITEHSLYK